MSSPACTAETDVSKIKLADPRSKRHAIILNTAREPYLRTRVDGCIIKNSLAADWVLSKAQVGQVIVELKGKDLMHGAKQVLATAQYMADKKCRTGRLSAIVVGVQIPSVDSRIQRAKVDFIKKFGGPLHFVSRNLEYQFDRLLAVDGPL